MSGLQYTVCPARTCVLALHISCSHWKRERTKERSKLWHLEKVVGFCLLNFPPLNPNLRSSSYFEGIIERKKTKEDAGRGYTTVHFTTQPPGAWQPPLATRDSTKVANAQESRLHFQYSKLNLWAPGVFMMIPTKELMYWYIWDSFLNYARWKQNCFDIYLGHRFRIQAVEVRIFASYGPVFV